MKYTTACPRNCYSTCAMTVEVEDGRLRRIEPHPGNLATPEGPCLKGLSYVERVHSKDRILRPLRKNTRGDFEPVSWEEALELITEHLTRLKRDYGPQSILYYSGSGTKGLLNAVGMQFWRMFGGCTTTYGDLCWPAGLEATRLTLGENKHSAPWDAANSRLIILWGKNSAETNIHQMLFIHQALEKGAVLVVIDPRRTQSAERAALHIQPRPGSDGAIALAVANRLIETGAVDDEFITKHVLGFEQFREHVAQYSIEWAAEIADTPAAQIEQLADYLARIKPAMINAGFGMQRYTNSGQTLRAIIALTAVTGNIGKPGAGWMFANLQSAVFDAVKDPLAFYPPKEPDGVVRVSISTAQLGRGIPEQHDPPIKMIWVERGNPATQNPDTNTVLKAFRSLEFRVVIEQFLTDTAREADLILPAKTMFEQTDVIGAYWHHYLQLKQKVIDPPGEVKPESEIYYLLAQRLGFDERDISKHIPGPSDADVQSYLKRALAKFPELSLKKLKDGPTPAPGAQETAFSDLVFPTPSGKIELYSEQAREWWDVSPLPEFFEPQESRRGKAGPKGRYPLYLMTPNTKNRIHSQFNNLELIRQVSPGPVVYIHPQDARERGIRDGQRVRIFNDRGELSLPAQLDFGLKPGCIAVTNGWWISQGGAVNFCSSSRETDMGCGAAFHDTLVEVEVEGASR